jgi:hypothetical protein
MISLPGSLVRSTRLAAGGFALVLIAGCSGGDAAAPTSVVARTTVASTSAPTTTRPATTTTPSTIAPTGPQWPAGSPTVDLANPDHIERTRELLEFVDWRTDDWSRWEGTWELWTMPDSPARQSDSGTWELNGGRNQSETNDCTLQIEETRLWERESPLGVWVEAYGSLPPCSGEANGSPVSTPGLLEIAFYYLWTQQLDGTWLVSEFHLPAGRQNPGDESWDE